MMVVGPEWFRKQLESASPDLLREMVGSFIAALMGAEADAVCGAPYGESSAERVNSRNGYRHREFDTRVGSLDVGIPKLRSGSYYPDWLLEPRWRAEQALTSVVATCYLPGVSTRRVERLVQTWGSTGCRSRRSATCEEPGTRRSLAFRNRPLDAGPYTYGWLERRADPSAHGVGEIRVLSRPPFTVRADHRRRQAHTARLPTALRLAGARPRRLHEVAASRSCVSHGGPGFTVPDEVRDDQRSWEEDQAEQEEPDEAVALSRGYTGRPERDSHPDEDDQEP